ncbi:MAG TPA: class I SAM-dependent methyltransferase [Syntrophorhabdaceae bacterium]|nr:class I SAM-dependent methyltransferase [Syntrophorhabdaceae bacterium]
MQKPRRGVSSRKNQLAKADNTTPHLAQQYDGQVRNTIPYYDEFHEETIRFVKATGAHPRLWLDTGCGTGLLVKRALSRFTKTTFVLADPSAEMIKQARKKLRNHEDSGRIKFLKPVATQDLKLDSQFDVITAIQSHHYLKKEEREHATRTCYDLLKRKGLFITFENVRPSSNEGIEAGKNYWSQFQLLRGKDARAVGKHMNRFDSEYFPIPVEEHLKLLKTCGFRTVELLWYSYMQAGFYGVK